VSHPRPCCRQAISWLRNHKGSRCFAPCEGRDFLAWETFVHAAKLYGFADPAGARAAVVVMHATIGLMRPELRHLARDVIPCVLDWNALVTLWPEVSSLDVVDHDSPAEHVAQIRSLRTAAPAPAPAGAP
jgi:hypothetical protein